MSKIKDTSAMHQVLMEAHKAKAWEYKSSDDFVTNGIADELGSSLNRELDMEDEDTVAEFWRLMPIWGM